VTNNGGGASPLTRWYHGTTNKRFAEGDKILPSREVGQWSNWTVFPEMEMREMESGRHVHTRDVVWITSSQSEAEGWAAHSTLKALPSEIRRMPAGGICVYEVEPFGLDRPTLPHGDGEACCAGAKVIREVVFDAFAQDECDGGCGEIATVFDGDDQWCATCAAEYMEEE
jgi:hypothetical protein